VRRTFEQPGLEQGQHVAVRRAGAQRQLARELEDAVLRLLDREAGEDRKPAEQRARKAPVARVQGGLATVEQLPVAGGLAGGVTLSSFGVVGRTTGWVGSLTAGLAAKTALGAGAYAAVKAVDFAVARAGRMRRARGTAPPASPSGSDAGRSGESS